MILRMVCVLILMSTESGLSQELIVLEDERLPGPDSVLIYKPEGYRNDIQYPLVILLHGWSGDYRQWSSIIDLQTAASKYQFIIACPDGFFDSWYIDSPAVRNSQFRSFFFGNLLPSITTSFGIDTMNVFVTGLSMGGFGAMSLFLHKPGAFRAAGSTSGILDIAKFPDRYGLDRVIGNFAEHEKRYRALSPIQQLDTAPLTGKTLVLDCGTEDFAYAVNESFYERCKSLNIDAIWISQKGTHGRGYWKKAIQQQLFLFSTLVKR